MGWKWLARQWHARGQGFKSPQLHPRSDAQSGPDRLQRRLAALEQGIDPLTEPGRSSSRAAAT
jgi:hypothetical protein